MHLANRRCHLLDGANLFDHKAVRQKSLIDELHYAFIFWVTPDGPEMFVANFHNPEHSLRAGRLQRSPLNNPLDIDSHRRRARNIFPTSALPEFSTAHIVVGHQDNSAPDANES